MDYEYQTGLRPRYYDDDNGGGGGDSGLVT